jgi:hypothetical protein
MKLFSLVNISPIASSLLMAKYSLVDKASTASLKATLIDKTLKPDFK